MEDLLDVSGDYSQTELNVKRYLKSLSDENLRSLYQNIELTPLPLLLAKEYKKRFGKRLSGTGKK